MKCDNFPLKSDNLILDFGWLDPHISIMRGGGGGGPGGMGGPKKR